MRHESHEQGISRRGFLVGGVAGAATLTLGLRCFRAEEPASPEETPPARPAPPAYGDWRDVYRERWRWDKIVKSTHFVNCWYQAHCCWNVYVKDGLVWREEQAANYPQTNPDVPDFNPRGCQKGGCVSERMYDPARVRYPLKRVGPRGSTQWKRISWDEALSEIAEAMLDTLVEDGSDRIVWDMGPLYTEGTMAAAHQRHVVLLDSTCLDMNSEIGDAHRGVAETFGKISFERSADDYFYSDLILIWGSNPLYTQIPNAHFLTEARYKGAQLVCIAPDYSPSSIRTDLFVPVSPGCDAALGLGIAHVLVEEDLVDRDFAVEQTDLPLLVREDTRLFLRSSDLEEGGSDEELYLHDAQRGVVAAPRRSLALEGLRPSLEGRFEVTLADGKQVAVRTVFSLLWERLADYTPEQTSKLCGTPASLIRELALRLARAKAAAMVTSSNLGDVSWEKLKKQGFSRFEKIGNSMTTITNATEIEPGETITPLTKHVLDKVPYPTLSRRMQFYLDQELYLELGEELPVHKDPPLAGGDYPLMLTGGHARWSIHGNWRDDQLMLQQQRGEPVILIGVEDAAARGIADGAQVRVFNDLDEFQVMAKVSPTLRKGQLLVYHAWESFQFKNGKGFQNLTPSPLNPVELSGGQYHLRPMLIASQPGHTDRDTRVEVEAVCLNGDVTATAGHGKAGEARA
jgi:anaerobic selenocysteine-containing dehydrogenase